MTEPAKTRDRCGAPLAHDPIVVTVASGPPPPIPSPIHLCGPCFDSMSHWMLRRRRSHGRPWESSHRARAPRPRVPSHRERRSVLIRGAILVVLAVVTGVAVWVLAHFVK